MSLFNTTTFLTPFVCPHCGASHWEENGSVPACSCPQSQVAEVVLREAQRAFVLQKKAQEPTLVEIRQMRKLRTRKCES